MASLTSVMAWIMKNYPHEHEMSNARLTKMVYLSDWHHTVYAGRRMTDIDWFFDNHGPFVWDIKDAAVANSDLFEVLETKNMYGSRKTLIRLRDRVFSDDSLSETEKSSVISMIEVTKKFYWDDFITFVYSTFPVLVSKKYSRLDLEALANRFREERRIILPA